MLNWLNLTIISLCQDTRGAEGRRGAGGRPAGDRARAPGPRGASFIEL